jgi:trimethylamine--corrinoid protein Co-methyltransferase
MVLDAELLQMIAVALEPLKVDDESLAVATIAEVGPGGHFFGTDHTRSRFRTAFHRPMLSDWRNYEAWDEAGRPMAENKTATLAKEFLASHQDPAIDPQVRSELADFVARRVAEGGVATDY